MRSKASGTQFALRETLIYLRLELGRGLTTVLNLRPAVVFVGSSSSFSVTDPEVQFICRLSEELWMTTALGIRLGVSDAINDAVTESVRKTASSYENNIDITQ